MVRSRDKKFGTGFYICT